MISDTKSCSITSDWDKVFHRWVEDEISVLGGKFTTADIIRSSILYAAPVFESQPWLMFTLWDAWESQHQLSRQIVRVPWRHSEPFKEFLRDFSNRLKVDRNKLSILAPLCALPMFKACPVLVSSVYQRFLESQYVSCMPRQMELSLGRANSVCGEVRKGRIKMG